MIKILVSKNQIKSGGVLKLPQISVLMSPKIYWTIRYLTEASENLIIVAIPREITLLFYD